MFSIFAAEIGNQRKFLSSDARESGVKPELYLSCNPHFKISVTTEPLLFERQREGIQIEESQKTCQLSQL